MLYNKNIVRYIITLLLLGGIFTGLGAQQNFQPVSVRSNVTATRLIDGFDFDKESNEPIGDLTWDIKASRFITQTDNRPYPQKTFVHHTPFLLPDFLRIGNEENLYILGARAAFNIKGTNFLYFIPTDKSKSEGKKGVFTYAKDGKSFKEGDVIPGYYFREPVVGIGLYVLGILRDYHLSVEFQNYNGEVFTVNLGKLNYRGWRILENEVPFDRYVKDNDLVSQEYYLRLNKIILRTAASEIVDDFELFFDSLFYVRPIQSLAEEFYDGYQLNRPDSNFEWESTNQSTQSTDQ